MNMEELLMEVLFGQEAYIFGSAQPDTGEIPLSRVPNGAWRCESGPRYTRVSAVLFTIDLSPWNVMDARMCLCHNPWAQRPYTLELSRLSLFLIQEEDRMVWKEGESLDAILNLPSG
jgi:hypothetical protein